MYKTQSEQFISRNSAMETNTNQAISEAITHVILPYEYNYSPIREVTLNSTKLSLIRIIICTILFGLVIITIAGKSFS